MLQQQGVLQRFVDDIYIFSKKHRENCVFARSRFPCTTREGGSTSKLVANIGMALAEAYNHAKNHYITIVHTIAREGAPTCIRDTITEIEARQPQTCESKRLGGGRGVLADKEPTVFFGTKMDVSELALETLHAGHRQLERCLEV